MTRLIIAALLALSASCALYNEPPNGADAGPPSERVTTDRGESLDIQCKAWCGEHQSCTGNDWRVCWDDCMDEPSLLDEPVCPE